MAGRKPDPRKRAQILHAATDLFSARDFHTVPVDDVATAAGCGKGTLYLYFPTKEHLFYAAILDALDALIVEIEAAVRGQHGQPALLAFARAACQFFWQRRHLTVLMQRYEHRQREPEGIEWRARRARIAALAREIIQSYAGSRRLSPDESALATEMLLAMIRAAVLNHQDRDRPERVAALVVDLFVHGLSRTQGRTARRAPRSARTAGARR